MAMPKGYTWARELDPNALWNKGILTAMGKTYKPGEYYLEGGRAYIPGAVNTPGITNTIPQGIPQGFAPIRSYFTPGQVTYNPAQKMIGLPYGLNIPQSQLFTSRGQTYAPASQLAQAYGTYAQTYKPQELTTTDVQKKAALYRQLAEPLMQANREQRELEAKKYTSQAEQQRRLAETAYQASLSGLQRAEGKGMMGAAHSVAGRNLSSSPLAEYERRKVAEAYAPEYQQLETSKAAQLANIASQAALAMDTLAQQGRTEEAQYAGQAMQWSLQQLQEEQGKKLQQVQSLAQYLSGLAASQQAAQQEAAKLAWEKEKEYIPYKNIKPAEMLPYQHLKPGEELGQLRWETEWPYKQAQYKYNLNKPYYKPESTQEGLTGIFYELGTGYKSPYDFKADLQRYASTVTKLVGAKNYQELLKYLGQEQKEWEKRNTSTGNDTPGERLTGNIQAIAAPWGVAFTPGMKSPLREWLRQQGYIK